MQQKGKTKKLVFFLAWKELIVSTMPTQQCTFPNLICLQARSVKQQLLYSVTYSCEIVVIYIFYQYKAPMKDPIETPAT